MKPGIPSRARRSGFTLIELMVVVGIIVVLAGLTIGSMAFINQKKKFSKAEMQVALLSNALDSYHADFAAYPDGDGSATSTVVLREELHPLDGTGENKRKIYLADLGESNAQGWGTDGPILDPWGNPYFYRSPGEQNPDFDLWSEGDPETPNDDVTNW